MKTWIIMIAVLLLAVILTGCAGEETEGTVKEDDTVEMESSEPDKSSEDTSSTASATKQTNNTITSPEIIRDDREGINPATLEIPAIDVKAEVEKVGLLENGQMGVPEGSENVAWFEPGPKPGEPGNSVIAGHVDDLVNPAVFYNLHKLEQGDKIYVTAQDGKKLTFVVRNKEVYPRQDAPLEDVFGFTYRSMLNLITCTGDYNDETTERADRLVVFTELVKN
ncbi:class F sortase [Radiobacillus sp. PE A8.2]|uniref:class F sortase n=1 Tax=Radiobacillus sp. PE A8.2 TaxID=3380349 RepID=UPI00388DB208